MKDTFLLYSPTEQRFPLFIRAIEPQAPTSWHSHDLVELAVILRGRAEHVTGAGRCPLRRGDVLLIPRGVYHRYDETSADFSIFNILFVPEEFPVPPMDLAALPGFATLRNPASCEGIPSCRIPGAEFKAVTQLLDLMLHEATEHPAGFNFILQNLFLTLAGMLCRWLPAPARATGQSHGVEKALAFLNSHYQSTVTNAQFARLAHLSVAALLRNFAIRAGASPRQYQLALRIDEARALLQSSARPCPKSPPPSASTIPTTSPASSESSLAAPQANSAARPPPRPCQAPKNATDAPPRSTGTATSASPGSPATKKNEGRPRRSGMEQKSPQNTWKAD